jgi:imidazole glycerol-phosphate synthase subunit HisF
MKRRMFLGASNLLFKKAVELRNNMTYAELLLWGYLKTKPLDHKFRRQHPISQYIADFYCHSLKLVIEIDGEVHTDIEVANNDVLRQKHLESEGIRFLRFTNEQVEKHLEQVITTIENFIHINKPL